MGSDGFRPLGDRLIVRKDDLVTELPGGLVIPEEAAERERKKRGVVTHVGPGRLLDDGTRAPMDVRVGDCIMYHEYAGSVIDLGDEKDYVVIEEKDALVVLPKGN